MASRSQRNWIVSGVAASPSVRTGSFAPNWHDSGSTTARSVDEVALIQDTLSYYAPVLIAPLSNSSRPACRDFFLGPRKGREDSRESRLSACQVSSSNPTSSRTCDSCLAMTKLLSHPQVKPLLSDEQGRQRRCDGGPDFHGQKYLFGKKRQQQEQSRQ